MSWCDLEVCLIKKIFYNMYSDCYDENVLTIGRNILVSYVQEIKDKVHFDLCSVTLKSRLGQPKASNHDVWCFHQVLRLRIYCHIFLSSKSF